MEVQAALIDHESEGNGNVQPGRWHVRHGIRRGLLDDGSSLVVIVVVFAVATPY